MPYMFYENDSLKDLNLSSFNTENFIVMNNIFNKNSSLNNLS